MRSFTSSTRGIIAHCDHHSIVRAGLTTAPSERRADSTARAADTPVTARGGALRRRLGRAPLHLPGGLPEYEGFDAREPEPLVKSSADERALLAVKIVHTIAWAFFVLCIAAIPVLAWLGEFVKSSWFVGVVFVEVLVIVLNRWRCPLTPVAARFTEDRRANFDIFLPEWIARHNKTIFGALYLAGVAYLVLSWAAHRP
jgi:hypothetical protein